MQSVNSLNKYRNLLLFYFLLCKFMIKVSTALFFQRIFHILNYKPTASLTSNAKI